MPHETAQFKQDAGVEYVKFTDLETQQKLCDIMEASCLGWLTIISGVKPIFLSRA